MIDLLKKHRMRIIPWALLAAAALFCGFEQQHDVLNLDALTHPLFPFDQDNWVRMTQVRQWMAEWWTAGAGFFDHAVRGTNAPFGGIEIHWTRPVDFTLLLLGRLMPGTLTPDQRVMLAAAWLPPILGIAAMAALLAAARKVLKHTHALWCLMALAVTNIVTTNYFKPGYADHHGPLCLLWCVVLALTVKKPGKRASLAIGAILGLMVWISVEAFLVLAPVYVIFGLSGLEDRRQMRGFTLAATAAAAVSAIAVFVEFPADKILAPIHYDMVSIVYVVFLSLCAAGVALLDFAFPRLRSNGQRLAAAAVAGAVILGVMFAAFPKFFGGPQVDADPFIPQKFLPSIVEARSLMTTLKTFPPLFIIDTFQAGLAAFLLFATRRANLWRRKGRQMAVLAGLLAYTFLLTSIQVRWNYYLQPVAMVLIAALLPLWAVNAGPAAIRWMKTAFPAYARPYVIIYLLSAAAAVPMYFSNGPQDDMLTCAEYMQYDVEAGRVRKSLGDGPLNLLTTAHLAGVVQFFTPYRVVAGNYNREAEGLKYLDAVLNAKDFAAARPLLEQREIDAVMFCPAAHDEDTWISKLSDTGSLPPWIAHVPGATPKYPRKISPMMFRINTSSAATGSKHPSLEGSCGRGCEPPAAR